MHAQEYNQWEYINTKNTQEKKIELKIHENK